MTVEGETPETNEGAGTPPTPTTPAGEGGTPTVDYQAMYEQTKAENEQLLGKKGALETDLHKIRERRKAEEDSRIKALEENSEFKALSDERGKRLEEATTALEASRGDAELGRAHREREEARIKTVRETMDEQWQAALDAAPTVQAKANVADLFAAATAKPEDKTKPRPPADGGGAPNGSTGSEIDFAAEMAKGSSLAELKRKHPEQWQHELAKAGAERPRNSLAFRRK